MKVARLFTGRSTSVFATTYSIELEFFDEYLFRRLGEPPLNATVLMDAGRHAHLWDSGGDLARRLRRANRDYLLRPVGFGSGAFHPKTYMLGNATEGALLVGSGNLTLGGVERGREVFAHFDSREPSELASIRGWRDWMNQVVDELSDPEVTYRWLRLRQECSSWLEGDSAGSQFIASSRRAIIDQLAEHVEQPIDELHVLAPFWDRKAQALAALVDRFVPSSLHIYLCGRTSVDGDSLRSLLAALSVETHLYQLEPNDFVHAKLIGLVKGSDGVLLFGSPNLSRAALLASGKPWCNIEAGVVIELEAEELRRALLPPEHGWKRASLDLLSDISFVDDERPLGLPLLLRAAWPENDGRISIKVVGELPAGAILTAGAEGQPLQELATVEPLAIPAAAGGILVWLADAQGAQLSNKVPLDDRNRLRSWLQERSEAGAKPRELDGSDFDTPVGQMLLRLHEECIFDIDETPALARASGLTAGEASEEETESWETLEELLAKEELARDPRVEHYRREWGPGLLDDDVSRLLSLMLDRAPGQRPLWVVANPSDDTGDPTGTSGVPWTPEQRLRVRLFNVLKRWSDALADPRFAWIDPAAPVRNYMALLVAQAECWEQGYLPEERVVPLLGALLGSFLRAERSLGYLVLLASEERERALGKLSDDARGLGAALVYCSIRPSANWRDYLFAWQPALLQGLEQGVLETTDATPTLVRRLVGSDVSVAQIDERLLWAVDYIDDDHWSAKQERDLGLGRVRLTKERFNPKFGITVAVAGDGASLDDPRLVSLIRQALAYRKTDGAIVEVEGDGRLSIELGQPVWALRNGTESCTSGPVKLDDLADLERQGISFARVLHPAGQAAS